jgi:hypothetical protein
VDDGLRPCRKHLLEMRPIKHVLGGGLSLQSPASPPSLQVSGIILGGSPAQSHKEGINCPLRAYGVDAFSGCLSPPVTFSVQSLSFNQEAF